MYDTTNITNANNIFEVVKATNDLSGGLIIGLGLLCLFVIVFIASKRYPTKAVFLVDSFIVSVIASLCFVAHLIGWGVLIIPLLLLFASIITYMITD